VSLPPRPPLPPAAGLAEDAVLAANEAFYDAFASRDFAAMDALWSKAGPVACIHPGWNPILDREQLMESWRAIMANPAGIEVSCLDPAALLLGEIGIVVCYEKLPEGVLAATNVFRLEDGVWRMVHHQATPTNEPRPEPPRRRESPPPSRRIH